MTLLRAAAAAVIVTFTATSANACQTTGSFNGWLKAFKADAAAQGVSRQVINCRPQRRHLRQAGHRL